MTLRSATVVAGIAVLLGAPSATAAPSKLQRTFRSALLADAGTTPAIKQRLRSGNAVVDPKPLFADLTGDGKTDAIVPLLSGGTAGTIAVYVLSSDGSASGRLHVIYRSQRLRRATVAVGAGPALVIGSPRYAAGDAVCCPAELVRRSYAWTPAKRRLRLKSTRTTDGPTAPAATPAPTSPPATTAPTTPTTTTPAAPGGGAAAP
ncbi:MAG TPA: hypothetical protein VFB41_09930 [Solirubrobacteraceae bacterium]|nr:hypothetical protein [Solirubrobacteraceae bacterium]